MVDVTEKDVTHRVASAERIWLLDTPCSATSFRK